MAESFAVVSGRMRQALTNWRHNTPAQHAEYAAEHALQLRHVSTSRLLEVLEAGRVTPANVAALAARMAGRLLRCEGLVYGNAGREEALGELWWGCGRHARPPRECCPKAHTLPDRCTFGRAAC